MGSGPTASDNASSPCASPGSHNDPYTPRRLTPRELEVRDLLLAGYSYAQIAAQLHISYETVHTHCRHIYRKIGVASRGGLQAAAVALVRDHLDLLNGSVDSRDDANKSP